MRPFFLPLIALLVFTAPAVLAQPDLLKTPLLHVKGRMLMIANGVGVEYFPARRHSVELYGVGSFYTWTPSIDHTRERALIAAYRYYLRPRFGEKGVRRWYLSPFLKRSRLTYGTGDLNDGDTYRHRGVRWCPGFVLGRQVLKGLTRQGLIECFIGPQFVMARDLEKVFASNGPVYNRWMNRQFWTLRAGIDVGIVRHRQGKQ